MKQERDWSAFGKTRVKWMEQHAKEKAERWSQGHCTCCSKGDGEFLRERERERGGEGGREGGRKADIRQIERKRENLN